MSAATDGIDVAMIWAQDRQGVIGSGGQIPWNLPEDMARFRSITMGHPVIMGRRTWQSLPAHFRPLPGRANLVLSADPTWAAGQDAVTVRSADSALAAAIASGFGGPAWVIGGAQIYRLFEPRACRAEITVVDLVSSGDTYAPSLAPTWQRLPSNNAYSWLTSRSSLRYRFETWLQHRSQ
jgi:dihydrofolate reductase